MINQDQLYEFRSRLRCIERDLENFLKNAEHDYHLNPGDLSSRNREMLKQAFKAVSKLQDLVGSEFGELIL